MEELLLGRKHYHILRLFSEKDGNEEGIRSGYITTSFVVRALSKKYGRTQLYADLKKLKDLGLIKRVKHSEDKKFYYYLSANGEKIISQPSSRHTFLLSKTLKELVLKFGRIKTYFSPEEISCPELGLDTTYINPDSVLKVENKDKTVSNCAFELELTQKSASRIRDKFEKYIEDDYFKNCFYLFEFERDFDKYTYIFDEFVKQIKDQETAKKAYFKFVFILNEYLDLADPSLENSKTLFNQRTSHLGKLLEDSKKQ
jgi:DNA-binding MarR family transcriptional regulator